MNYQTAALILLLTPLLSALVILLLHKTLRAGSVIVSLGSAGICLVTSILLLLKKPDLGVTEGLLVPFLRLPGFSADLTFLLDSQAIGMMFIVTFIGFLVHLYSVGYMKDDDAKPRFFGALSLFMFSMTGIVLAGNFIMMFVFWELVGVSSYLLIGHWFKKPEAADAAKKAFLTNRIGDFGFMIGILCLWAIGGVGTMVGDDGDHLTLRSSGIIMESGADYTPDLSFSGLEAQFESRATGKSPAVPAWLLTLAALGIFMGAVGKSAQVPLHVWLPDAMEGPTPVSALIHAATMVAAGVYMLVRVDFIIGASPLAMSIIAGIGGITALMAALMAVQQNDIKRILAYSTLSQLGYMVMAIGLGGSEAAMFHLYTHAFFKALLFLGAGAVIYACHHEQDIWKMGGLQGKTPATFLTFVIGTLALMGFPYVTSGFWSKEAILDVAYHSCGWLFAVAALTAVLTSFYMARCVIVAFFGKARTENADHAHEAPMIMIAPLLLLAIFAIGAGFSPFYKALQAMVPEGHPPPAVLFASIGALVIGAGAAFVLYNGKDKDPLNIKLFAKRFYIDEIYAWIVKVFQDRLAWLVTALESIFADGLVARLPAFVAGQVGRVGRALQSGHLQGYTMVLGVGLLVAIYLAIALLPRLGH